MFLTKRLISDDYGSVVRATRLMCKRSSKSHEFKSGLDRPTTGKQTLAFNPAVNKYLFRVRDG